MAASTNAFSITRVLNKRSGRRCGGSFTPFPTRIIQTTDLVGPLINNNCSARCIFIDCNVQSPFNLIFYLSAHIGDIGADNIFWERIGGDVSVKYQGTVSREVLEKPLLLYQFFCLAKAPINNRRRRDHPPPAAFSMDENCL